MAIPFEAGTKVRLKSGGADMMVVGEEAVIGVGTGQVRCEWQEKVKGRWVSQKQSFAATSLEVVPPDNGSFKVTGT